MQVEVKEELLGTPTSDKYRDAAKRDAFVPDNYVVEFEYQEVRRNHCIADGPWISSDC